MRFATHTTEPRAAGNKLSQIAPLRRSSPSFLEHGVFQIFFELLASHLRYPSEAASVGDENLKTTDHFKTFQNTNERSKIES